jgi:hypothetical protein
MGHHDSAAGASGILHKKSDAIPGLELEGAALALGHMRQSDSGGGGGKGAKGKMKKGATGGHGQAPLFRGARYAGLTLRQSQAAFSYMPASQNWQAILASNSWQAIPGKQFWQAILASNSWAYFTAIPRNGSMGFPERLKMPRSAHNHAPG